MEEEEAKRKKRESDREFEYARIRKELMVTSQELNEANRELLNGRSSIETIVEDKDNQIKSLMSAMEIFKEQYNKSQHNLRRMKTGAENLRSTIMG